MVSPASVTVQSLFSLSSPGPRRRGRRCKWEGATAEVWRRRAARELRSLSRASLLGDAFVAQATARLRTAAAGCASQLASVRADSGWGAGLSCHECVFVPLHRTLLGLWALGCPDAALLAELARCEEEGMLHPSLRGMQSIAAGGGGAVPLFLLLDGAEGQIML